jgi:hypothetical protein
MSMNVIIEVAKSGKNEMGRVCGRGNVPVEF